MNIAFDDPRIELARQTIGAVGIVADPALPPHLLHLIDSRGIGYIAKQHRQSSRFVQETHAYATWVRHLRGRTPQLIGHQDATHTLLLTVVPGHGCDTLPPGSQAEWSAHRAAGATLQALHTATADRTTSAVGARLAQRLQGWVDKADVADLLSSSERRFLLHVADELAGTRMASAVCHLDYQPRNWRLGDGFWVLDFEHMRPDARVRDFARLEFRQWSRAPHLRDAFFDGYGRHPTEPEQRLLIRFGAIEAITALVRGHEQADLELNAHGRTILARLI